MGTCCTKASEPVEASLDGGEIIIQSTHNLRQYLSRQIESGRIDGTSAALVDDYEEIIHTFTQLDFEIHRLAELIKQALQFQPSFNFNEDGDTVIMFSLGNSDKMIFIMFAILELNLTYCAVDPTTTEDRLLKITRCLKPVLVIIDSYPAIISRFSCLAQIVRILTVDELLSGTYEGFFKIPQVIKKSGKQFNVYKKSNSTTAGIYFTSGTTSSGKGTRISTQAIFNRIEWQWETVPYEKDDIAVLLSLPTNPTSIADIFAPLLQGISLHLYYCVNHPKPEFLFEMIAENNITRLTISSNALEHVLETIEASANQVFLCEKLHSVKVWCSNGDALTYELVEQFFQLLGINKILLNPPIEGIPKEGYGGERPVRFSVDSVWEVTVRSVKLVHLYGTTETTADSVYEIFESMEDLKNKSWNQYVPLGIPIWNTKIYIEENEAFKILSIDNPGIGEICVSGTCLALGYTTCVKANNDFEHNERKENAPKYRRLHRTKDLGQILKCNDGMMRLFFKGRRSQIIKIKGERINLAEMAATIKETNLVENVEIIYVHLDNEDDILLAAVEFKVDVGPNMLLNFLNGRISDDIMPTIFPVVEIPLLPDGRLDYHTLYKQYITSRRMVRNKDWYTLHLPHYKIDAAQTLCEAVALSVGIPIRNVIDHFYSSFESIGGNSNNTVMCLQRIRERDYRIILDQFIQAKTLSDIMEEMVKAIENPPLVPLERIDILRSQLPKKAYEMKSLANEHKDDVIKIISEVYPLKNELIICLKADSRDFKLVLREIWDIFIKHNLSLVIKDSKTGKTCGCFLTLDRTQKYQWKKIPKPLTYFFELIEYIERETKLKTHSKAKILLPIFIGVEKSIRLLDKVLIVKNLLISTIERGIFTGFDEIHVITSQPLVRHLCKYMVKATVEMDYKVENFKASDKTKPYQYAGSHRKVSCFSKLLRPDSKIEITSTKDKRPPLPIIRVQSKHTKRPVIVLESDEEIPDYSW